MFLRLLLLLTCFVLPLSAVANEDPTIVPVTDNLHMLVSTKGGNVLVSTGADGVFLVDDQLTPRSDIIKNAVKSLSDKDISFIVNTHYHFDHTGGNEAFGEDGAIMVAHDNVRKRLNSKQFITYFNREMAPLSKAGLPVVTFAHDVTFHYNDNSIHIIHAPNAHTDGDAFAHFSEANVIATGDLAFNGMYPFVDVEHGGSFKGVIDAVDAMIAIADENTIIVPGHGPLMSLEELKAYRTVLSTVLEHVETAIKDGKSKEEIIAESPTQEFDAQMSKGIVSPDAFVELMYQGLQPQ